MLQPFEKIESEYIALARAVIVQAARDAAAGDVGAAAWLASDETADTWLMIAGVRRSAVLSWLKRPTIKKRTRPASKKNNPQIKKNLLLALMPKIAQAIN